MTYLVVMLFLYSEDKTFIGAVACFTNILAQLHVVLYVTALYVLRPNILYLLKSIQHQFWEIENCKDFKLQLDCYKTLHVLKWKYRIFCTLLFFCVLTYYYGRILESKETTPENMMFESYIPKWMNFWVMFAWQHLPAYGFPVIELAMDFTVFSIVSLTAMQFRLLRHEMEVIFKDSKDGIFVMDKFRKCSEHLTFLLGLKR
ncbi:unnamed protein product [Callosobruchus maculatus]|uniref:Odorant receptor n=1 Tax=Callosobruchus maculatus TaxID=64391 RepID=A0A653BP92_CALMS|nr:unnamed protein product [Callosobruchus maculatus]